MSASRTRTVALLLALSGLLLGLLGVPAHGAADAPPQAAPPAPGTAAALPLGPAGLAEHRTTTTLQPGVTLTMIERGEPDPATVWTVEVAIPGGSGSPDPDAPPTALSAQPQAEELAGELRADGFDARVERVTTPATADFAGGTLGWRVRVGRFSERAGGDAELARVRAAGYTASNVFTGWDGDRADRGPWRVQVLTIDPRRFRGELDASYGPDLERRETTSALSRADGATAAVNAGFFVLDPAAGAPGDPAGAGVYDGRLLSETVNGRPVLRSVDSGRAEVLRLRWSGAVMAGRERLALDGINRVPNLIRNCGGTADDSPTSSPLHDVTCTDSGELVAFTPAFAPRTPAGPGAEAVLDARDRVVEVRSPRGGTLPTGGSSVQATGDLVDDLSAVAKPRARLTVQSRLVDAKSGREVRSNRRTDIVNGGPELVRDGHVHATPMTDGMVHPGNPSFYYGWAHKRNPRTLAGIDKAGRTVLVTADGRSTRSLGLSITESAEVAKALGLHDAVNLDGGGSTTMVVGGAIVNEPSDAAGERPVGDALLVLPGRR